MATNNHSARSIHIIVYQLLDTRENSAVVTRIESKYNIVIHVANREGFKGLCHAICYLFKKLKLFSHRLNSKNNGPVLFSETTFEHWNCFLSSVAMHGKSEYGLKRKRIGPTFSSFNATHAKSAKKIAMVNAPWWTFFDIFISLREHFIHG